MDPFDRKVRAAIYAALVDEVREVDAAAIASRVGWSDTDVASSLENLADEHRIALTGEGRVWMAHPFSGVPTSYRAMIGDRFWYANCAWDSLAILAMLGDGEARGESMSWRVSNGSVIPDSIVYLLVPARRFWDDIGFT